MRNLVKQKIQQQYDVDGIPICIVPSCNDLCNKFKNGKFSNYCDLHNGYSVRRETHWGCFKTRILCRDNSRCIKCGSNEDLEVDHILAICNGGEMWKEENLQTLCRSCHKDKTKQDLNILKSKRKNKNILRKERDERIKLINENKHMNISKNL